MVTSPTALEPDRRMPFRIKKSLLFSASIGVPSKVSGAIKVIPSGKLISDSEVQSLNAFEPMEATEEGIRRFCKLLQPSKALLPIERIPSGRVMDAKLRQPLNKLSSITVILGLRITFSSEIQSAKALLPRALTVSGIIISFKEAQPLKALCRIDFNPFGRVIASKDEQLIKT